MPKAKIVRILFLAVLLLFTDQNLYPSFNYSPFFKGHLQSKSFRQYELYQGNTLAWPEIITNDKNTLDDTSYLKTDKKMVSHSTVFTPFTQDSLKASAQWVYNTMFPFQQEETWRSIFADNLPNKNSVHDAATKNIDSLSYLNFKIMGEGKLTEQQMHSFFLSNSDSTGISRLSDIILLYIQECRAEGVNHDIAFIQMCLETGFLKYNGIVKARQNNFCGLGAINKNNRGESFKTAREGIRAHVQHLKAYASQDTLNNKLIDNRFDLVKRGSAKVLKELTGKWATDPKYDRKLLGLIIRIENHNNTSLL